MPSAAPTSPPTPAYRPDESSRRYPGWRGVFACFVMGALLCGFGISLALNGASFGGIVIVPALVFLSGATSFTTAMLAGAALVLALMLPVAFTILGAHVPRAPTADRTGLPSKDDTGSEPQGEWTRASALRSLAFWNVSGTFSLAITSQAGFQIGRAHV